MNKTRLCRASEISRKGHHYEVEFWGGEVAEVSIVGWPNDAFDILTRTTRGYAGKYTMEPFTIEERAQYLADIQKTKLGTPTEMVNFVFLIRDVPRSWTHQAVRTRIGAAVVQESTRFIGSKDVYKVLVPKSAHHNLQINTDYLNGILSSVAAYENAVATDGVSSQDARQLLPHALLTHMFWSLTLKTLMTVYNQRWCCQAELSTWVPAMRQMKRLVIEKCGEEIGSMLTAPIDRGESCGYGASFDRPCVWKKREEV